MEKTISNSVIEYLENKDFVFGGVIARAVGAKTGHKESTVERTCRNMVGDKLETDYRQVNGKGPKVVLYKLKVKESLFD